MGWLVACASLWLGVALAQDSAQPLAGGLGTAAGCWDASPCDREGRPQDLLGRHRARCGDGAGASKVDRLVTFPTDDFKHGRNTVAIAYELFGSTEFGETARMAELNGIESIRLGADPDRATLVNTWDVQMFPAPVGDRQLKPGYRMNGQRTVSLGQATGSGAAPREIVPVFLCCQAGFAIAPGPNWSVP
jgi:hypothetical protein